MKTSKTLLIIDDEKEVCLLLQRLLSKDFGCVVCAHTLQEGLEKFGQTKPDLIILDNNLPDGLGITQIPHFKKNPTCSIIMISGMDIHTEALRKGADTFIPKPVSIGIIRNAIRQYAA